MQYLRSPLPTDGELKLTLCLSKCSRQQLWRQVHLPEGPKLPGLALARGRHQAGSSPVSSTRYFGTFRRTAVLRRYCSIEDDNTLYCSLWPDPLRAVAVIPGQCVNILRMLVLTRLGAVGRGATSHVITMRYSTVKRDSFTTSNTAHIR